MSQSNKHTLNDIHANGEVVLKNATKDHTKKRSNPSTQNGSQKSQVAKKVSALLVEDEPELKRSGVLWVNPGAGFDNPLKLTDIPVNKGKLFPRWISWARDDRISYILFDKNEHKYWADPAAAHILSRAEGYHITFHLFNFIVRRDKKFFKYGFTPKEYMASDTATFKIFKEYSHAVSDRTLKAAPPKPANDKEIDKEKNSLKRLESDEKVDGKLEMELELITYDANILFS